jgi:hypothetical protein
MILHGLHGHGNLEFIVFTGNQSGSSAIFSYSQRAFGQKSAHGAISEAKQVITMVTAMYISLFYKFVVSRLPYMSYIKVVKNTFATYKFE